MSEFQADHSRWDKLGLDMTVSNGVYGHAVQALSSLDVIEQNPKWQTDFNIDGWTKIQRAKIIRYVEKGLIPVEALVIGNIEVIRDAQFLLENEVLTFEQVQQFYTDVIHQ